MKLKKVFLARIMIFMLLLALPTLACSTFSGDEGNNEPDTNSSVAEEADATESPPQGEESEESGAEEPAGDSQDDSAAEDDEAASQAGAAADSDAASDTPEESTESDANSEDSDEPDDGEADSDGNGGDGNDTDTGDNDGSAGDGDSSVAGDVDSAPAGEGWGASGTGAQSACDHPYFPLRTGATWTYEDGENSTIWEVTDVQGDLEQATANLRISIGDVSIDYQWSCAEGSGMASFDFANVGSAATGLQMTLEQESADGQFLLPVDQLEPGATWDTNIESAFTFTQGEGDILIEVAGDMTLIQTNEVIGTDPVTFNGITTEGLQIEQTDNINLTMIILENAVNQAMNIVNTNELGWGIGMVSQNSMSDFGPSTSTLVSYFIP